MHQVGLFSSNITMMHCPINIRLQAESSACNTDTTPTQPHRNSNTHRTKNNTTNEVIQQNSRELLMMDILMSETWWAHKKWNKIASDIKLVFYSSTVTIMHCPINIRFALSNVCNSGPLLHEPICAFPIWYRICSSLLEYTCLFSRRPWHL